MKQLTIADLRLIQEYSVSWEPVEWETFKDAFARAHNMTSNQLDILGPRSAELIAAHDLCHQFGILVEPNDRPEHHPDVARDPRFVKDVLSLRIIQVLKNYSLYWWEGYHIPSMTHSFGIRLQPEQYTFCSGTGVSISDAINDCIIELGCPDRWIRRESTEERLEGIQRTLSGILAAMP